MTSEKAQYFYAQLDLVNRDSSQNLRAVLETYTVLGDALSDVTADEPQLFADLHARLIFVFDKYALPEHVQHQVQALRLLAKSCRKTPSLAITTEQVAGSVRAVCLMLFHFSNEQTPATLRTWYTPFPPLHYKARKVRKKEVLPFLQVTVLHITPSEIYAGEKRRCVLTCAAEELGTIQLALWDKWSELEHLLWPFATLNVLVVQKISEEQHLYSTTKDSLVVLEPDFLIDATDIAECFQYNGANPNLYLLKKFVYAEQTEPMLLGNIANFCFDELIADSTCDFDDIFARALRQKPLQVVALLHKTPHLLPVLRDKARTYFTAIKTALSRLQYDAAITEPTFISSLYGLQGRLDVMIEHDNDSARKDIIELKSGAPSSSQPGLWRNHLAQVTCYNLLLDSCYKHRSGSSSVLYLRAEDNTPRNAPNIIYLKQDIIALRNHLVAIERELSNRKFRSLKKLTPEAFGTAPPFTQPDIRDFALAMASATPIERKYFHVFTAFVTREYWSGKIGSSTGEYEPGFAGLWRLSIAEKEARHNVLAGLELNAEQSNFAQLHLAFNRTENTLRISTFRTGDIVLLYPLEADGSAQPLNHQILKGTIKSLTPEHIVVSLRNKQQRSEDFHRYTSWVVERDFLATGYKAMHESLYDFLRAPSERKEFLLGIRQPAFAPVHTEHYNYLTTEQYSLLNRAMSAQQYFLLQGPPGTGKTSRMLKSMIQHLYEHTDEHIIVLAFTNRAVDELCQSIKSITPNVPFIRLGAKDSTEHTDVVITELLNNSSIEHLAESISNTRIIVSTVSSLLKNRELLQLKTIRTAIVDEAAQIVEPQIVGLLSQFERFILIGDEKQLPSVVTQQECGLSIADNDLNTIGIKDLRLSLFERLFTLCKRNNWHDAYGMISQQGRMHHDIQEFPNSMFYDGKLSCLQPWQTERDHTMYNNADAPLADILRCSRLLFLPSEREQHAKLHREEARRTAALVVAIQQYYNGNFTDKTLGIITPYRAQIAAITEQLPPSIQPLVTVDTVERYQGSERDIIIFSFAANHVSQLRNLQSLTADCIVDRKLNVALTRARHQMIILGCPDVLSHEPLYRNLLHFIGKRNGYVPFPTETTLSTQL